MPSRMQPRDNPFPDNPVVTNTIEGLPDYQTKSFLVACEKLDIFIEDFQVASSKPSGLALGVRGRVGSGKTHALFQLMQHVRGKPLTSKTIYAKAEKADIWDVYVNHFAREFNFDDLRNLISLHLAKLLRMRSPESASDAPGHRSLLELARRETDNLVRKNPQEILRLVQEDLLPVSDLRRHLNSEIKATPQGPNNDFFLAYSRLTDDDLGPLAVRWLKGEKLTPSEQRDLGLAAAAIETPGQAQNAFLFLLSAFRKADYAVMFCLDEFERLGAPGPPEAINQLASLLKDLAEVFKGTGQVLVVAGVQEAWDALTVRKDISGRFRRSDIIEIKLEEREGRGLLAAYCAPRELQEVFDKEGVGMLSEGSRRNARQLLTLAHRAYADALADGGEFPVSAVAVEHSLTDIMGGQQRLDAVLQGVGDIAKDLALPVWQEGEEGGVKYRISLGDAERPSVALLVVESIFKLDEVAAANTVNEISHGLRRRSARTRVCVVIVGYSTAQIREDLEKVVERVFVFGEDIFLEELREFLRAAPLKDSEVEQKILEQDAAYRELLQKFDTYEQSRRDELEQLTEALANVQQQVARAGDTAREKRVKDKMEETLSELKSLLHQEEGLLSSLLPPEGGLKRAAVVAAYGRAKRLLEDQRTNIKRALILNEKMRQAERFSELLTEARRQVETASDHWSEIYRSSDITDASSIPRLLRKLEEAQAILTDRRKALTDLELLHLQRLPDDTGSVFRRFASALGRTSLLAMIVTALTVLGLFFAYRGITDAWDKEMKVLQNYSNTLNKVQNVVTRLRLLDMTVDKQSTANVSQDLVVTIVALRESESELGSLKYLRIGSSFNQETEEWLLRARYILAAAARANLGNVRDPALDQYEEWVLVEQTAAQEIIRDCTKIKSYINSITFSTFAWRFIGANVALLPLIALPLLLLLAWRLYRRLHVRLVKSRRMRPAHPAETTTASDA